MNACAEDALQWLRTGLEHLEKNDNKRAVAAFTRAIELDPKLAAAYNNRGVAYNELKQHQQAIADCTKAIELDPKYAAAYYNRGVAYDELKQYQQAIADYTKAIELDPDDPTILHNRGITYYHIGKYELALADYNRSLELRPDHHATLTDRGSTYDSMGKHELALADFNHSLELRPDYAEALNGRGVALFHLGRMEEALHDFTQVVQLAVGKGKEEAQAHFNRAATLLKLDRRSEAQEALERAVHLDPADGEARRALRQLQAPGRGDWWGWWFSGISPWLRKVAGGTLVFFLAIYLVIPLLPPEPIHQTHIPGTQYLLNVGQTWEHYLVPTAVILGLLLLPAMSKFQVGPVSIEPRPPEPRATPDLQPRLTTTDS